MTYNQIIETTGYSKAMISYYCSDSTKVKALDYQAAHREKVKKFVYEYKSSRGCSLCEEKDPRCLDFHHHDDNKSFCIGSVARRDKYSIKRVMGEIEKCTILCANCHRKTHIKTGAE